MNSMKLDSTAAENVDHCRHCGEPTIEFVEGYCLACHNGNQLHLDAHIAQFEQWDRLSEVQRENRIRLAFR